MGLKIKGVINVPGQYLFYCPGCDQVHAVWTDPKFPNPKNKCVWSFNGDRYKPTFTPSLDIKGQCHSIVTNGNIYFCPDSVHHLAGQTVEIPDISFFWGTNDFLSKSVLVERYKTEFVHFMPTAKEPGTLYISYAFQLAIHLCACGCGVQSVTKLAVNGRPKAENVWDYTYHDDGSSSLYASILNRWCNAHYFIERGKVRWT